MLTKDQLKTIFPKLAQHQQRLDQYFPLLTAALLEGRVNTPQRLAAYLAQVGHESDEFHYMSEVWGPTPAQLRYERPAGAQLSTDPDAKKWPLWQKLGNLEPGDGYRFRGAGPIQVTGRSNFRAADQILRLGLEAHPEQAFTPAVGFRMATWFWASHGLNELADALTLDPGADADRFDEITKRINGGLNGKPERDAYYARLCQVLRP